MNLLYESDSFTVMHMLANAEGEAAIPPQLPTRLLPALCRDNALETYPRLKETLA